jgi:hypothetical protein
MGQGYGTDLGGIGNVSNLARRRMLILNIMEDLADTRLP